jgi:hypothetical protein
MGFVRQYYPTPPVYHGKKSCVIVFNHLGGYLVVVI